MIDLTKPSLLSKSPTPLRRVPSIDLAYKRHTSMRSTISLKHLPVKASFDSSMPVLAFHASQPSSPKGRSRRTSTCISTRFLEAERHTKKSSLGPGSYLLPETKTGSCFEFPMTERFELTYREKIEREA